MNDAGRKVSESCSECDKVELEKKLDAAESALAFERELKKLDKEHELTLDTAEDTATTDLQKARWQNEFDLSKLFHEKVSQLAEGSIERSRDSAKYVQIAASAILAIYTAMLGLVFSATANPLPIRGIYPAIFLALAIALAVGYLAFITDPDKVDFYDGGESLTEQQMNRTRYLVKWVSATVRDRRIAIRASVVSLAIGAAFIPAPFVSGSRPPDIPAAPDAPTIPRAIPPSIEEQAAKLFRSQLESYEAAAVKRNNAIEKASTEATDLPNDESDLNSRTLVLAIIGLGIVFLGPWTYGRLHDEEDDQLSSAA